MKKKNLVYVALAADIIHEGHINILKIASRYGKVIVGLLTDRAIASYKKFPYLSYKQRYAIVKNLKYVHKVMPQTTQDYSHNLRLIKPKLLFMVTIGKKGVNRIIRKKLLIF